MKTNDPSIFVVEDDAFYSEIIRATLTNKGYNNLAFFDNGNDCLNSLDRDPDIVILDHMLGQVSGVHVLRQIKSMCPKTQVIFLSGQEDMDVVVRALKLGAMDYIDKTHKLALTRLMVMVDRALTARNNLKTGFGRDLIKRWFMLQ